MSFWNRKIKNVKEISRRTGIEEEKIKELKEGKREIGGDTMDKVLKAVNDSKKETKMERQIREKEVYDWCVNANIKSLIKEFGYSGQTEIAPYMGVTQSFISNFTSNKIKGYTPNVQKMYDFFQDDFNKKTTKTSKHTKGLKIKVENETEIIRFFKDNTLKDITKKLNMNCVVISKNLGISKSTLSCLFNGRFKYVTPLVVKIYNYLNEELNKEKEMDNVLKQLETAQISSNEEVNVNASSEPETIVNEAKNEEKTDTKENTTDEEMITVSKEKYNKLICDYMKTIRENINLQKQIERYEKLIDRLD